MNSPTIGEAVASLASNPKVATAAAIGTTTLGIADKLELIQSAIGTASLFVGFVTGCVVLAIQMIKLARYWRSLDIEP